MTLIEGENRNGFNFGVTNYRLNALEDVHLYTVLTMKVMIEKQFLYKEDSGYGIFQAETDKGEIVKISGIFPTVLHLGLSYQIKGKVIEFKGEKQLSVEFAKAIEPVTKNGIVEYLKNLDGLYRKAEYLFELYGENVLELIRKNPNKVVEDNPDIEKEYVLLWKEQIEKLADNTDHLSQLTAYGLNLRQAKKLYEKYQGAVMEKIQQNPYLLVSEFPSFGFKKADEIAKQIGYDPTGDYRIQEALKFVLTEATGQGHCYLPAKDLIERTINILVIRLTEEEMISLLEEYKGKAKAIYKIGEFEFPVSYILLANQFKQYRFEHNPFEKEMKRLVVVRVSREEICHQLNKMIVTNQLIEEAGNYYLIELYEAEYRVAKKVIELNNSKGTLFDNVEYDLMNFLKDNSLSLEERQKEAVVTFSKQTGGFYILNGSAGCGKTFTLNIILKILEIQFKKQNRTMEVKILAPTGKASKVAMKSTKRNTTTIHRGLKYKPIIGFEHNANNPIDADVVVVDESSMIDILLADSLFTAISNGTKVILLGDTKQLASVGAGNVLLDLIESAVIPIVTLNVVKRQGKESGIIRNANKIINGEMISSCKDTRDAYVLRKETVLEAQLAIIKSIYEVMKVMDISIDDIQILCPQKNSLIGTYAMNYLIQQEFNHYRTEYQVLNKKVLIYNQISDKEEYVPLFFKVGDKVIHMKNNYEMKWYRKGQAGIYTENFDTLGITNGECGTIVDVLKGKVGDTYKFRIIVLYEDGYVFYDDGFNELEHAYALTIHKSQGSQWKAVIMPIMMQNYSMLDNNIFYTGYTRAELFHAVIGQPEAIQHAIHSHKLKNRNTSLKDRILSCAN